MAERVAFISSEHYLEHRTPPGHIERAERIGHLLEYLPKRPVFAGLTRLDPIVADRSWVETVHTAAYIDFVRRSAERGPVSLDPDTVVSQRSFEVALEAVGALLVACDQVVSGQVCRAFCAVRPPGHHAEADRAMGFCLFNNVAIAARYLQKKHGLQKVLIIDWDVHHGNGTQHTFYEDSSVFYLSVHQSPLYPGTGSREERGAGDGLGTTLNVPLPPGRDDATYLQVFQEELAPVVQEFKPEAILISAGFDAHRDDPLGGMQLTENGFAALTREVCCLAREVASGRVISALEGGYDLGALARSVEAHLEAFVEEE